MKNSKKLLFSILITGLILQVGCKKKQPLNTLSVGPQNVAFASAGGTSSLSLTTDAQTWQIDNPNDWVKLSNTSGSGKEATITLNVDTKSLTQRYDTLTITAGNAKPVLITVSQLPSQYLYTLTTNLLANLNFQKAGDSATINIRTDAPNWKLTSDTTSWLQLSRSSGTNSDTTVTVKASQNTGIGARTATLTLSADHAPSVQILVKQVGDLYPDYNTSPIPPDASGMGLNAQQISSKMTLGMNIWNTLEAIGGETAWGNPKITQGLIDEIKKSGFNAIRLPCSWDQYANQTTGKISDTWLQRVKQVVQYCMNDSMYTILNIHWDGGWLQSHVDIADSAAVNAKQKAYWQQIATTMRDFDDHLMFASTNEPAAQDQKQMNILLAYHQTFINAVRSTGGRNSYRVLVIQGPNTSPELTPQLMTKMPTDSIPNHLIVEIHEYDPSTFTILSQDASWGKVAYYWGKNFHSKTDPSHNATFGEETYIDSTLQIVQHTFVDKGIPVIIGEFGANDHSNPAVVGQANVAPDSVMARNSFTHYLGFIARDATNHGITPFFWAGVFDRQTNTVNDQQALDSLLVGVGKPVPFQH
jgi:aryl-phospho-beta-D-glucosidase BglC (GH1 family)